MGAPARPGRAGRGPARPRPCRVRRPPSCSGSAAARAGPPRPAVPGTAFRPPPGRWRPPFRARSARPPRRARPARMVVRRPAATRSG
ncbi:hypothetical protein EF879_16205 [Micromonospora sp. HM5-17]|nr:hypothetical protein EF879_16205 [Micromonospora sp. HM5-17]